MICFREGSPPLPDVYNTSLTGLGKNLTVVETTFTSDKRLLSLLWFVSPLNICSFLL